MVFAGGTHTGGGRGGPGAPSAVHTFPGALRVLRQSRAASSRGRVPREPAPGNGGDDGQGPAQETVETMVCAAQYCAHENDRNAQSEGIGVVFKLP